MKQRPDHSTGPWWRRLDLPRRLVLGILVGLVGIVVFGRVARSEFVVRGAVEARLAAWESRLGGDVEIERIRPFGWTGVRFEAVQFRPADVERTAPLATVEVVEIMPDLGALLRGRVRPRHVSIRGVDADVALDLAEGGDAPWLRSLVEDAVGSGPDGPPQDAGEGRPWPTVEVVDARGRLRDVDGVAPVIEASVDRLTVARDASGRVAVDGGVAIDGIGRARVSGHLWGPDRELTLRMLDDNDLFALLPSAWAPSSAASFSVGAVSMAWPPRVTLGPVSLRQMNIELPHNPEWRLDDLWLHEATLEITADGWRLSGHQGRVGFAGLLAEADLRLASLSVSGGRAGGLEAAEVRLGQDDAPLIVRRIAGSDGVGVEVVAHGTDVTPWGRILPAALRTRVFAGRLDGQARLVRDGRFTTLDVDLTLSDGSARIAPLSSARMQGVEASIDGTAVFDAERGTVDVPAVFARLGALEVDAQGTVRRSDAGHRVEVAMAVPRVDAGLALQSMPEGLFEALDGLELFGPIEGGLRTVIDTSDPSASRVEIDFAADKVSVLAFGDAAPIDRIGDPDFFWWVETFEGSPRPVGPGTDDWVPLADMGPILPRAVMAAEDDAFYLHEGFDPRGIRAALQANLEAGRFVRGGSTITQQVVKNLFLSHERTIGRKLQEAVLTWLTERFVEKDRILEFYVNLAHWGPGIYGIQQASLRYFRHVPRQLTLRESAFLASILPNPALFGEQYGRQVIAPSRRVKMGNILRNLQRAGLIADADVAYHLQMIDRGMISTTPPPPDLGPPGSDPSTSTSPSLARGDTLLLFP